VNAELIHKGTKVTSENLTLTLPITGVVMNSFGNALPASGSYRRRPLMPERDPEFSRAMDVLDEPQAKSQGAESGDETLPGTAASSDDEYRAPDFLRAPGLKRGELKPSAAFER